MKNIFKKINNKHDRGFVLLFSVLVSAVIFFIGAGIFSISFKELLISSLAKESQKSIFAADAGVECGLQADTDGKFSDPATPAPFVCFGESIQPTSDGYQRFSFTVPFTEDKTCAIVTVIKSIGTLIYAQGYNKCNADGPVQFPGLAERVYKVSF